MGTLIKSLELFKDLVPPFFTLDHNQNRTVRKKFMVFPYLFIYFFKFHRFWLVKKQKSIKSCAINNLNVAQWTGHQ